MEMNEKIEKKIKEYINKNELFLISKHLVTKLHNHGGTDPRIILITEEFFVIATDSFSVKYAYVWYKIEELKLTDEIVHINFDDVKRFSFKSENFEQTKAIFEILFNHVHSIFNELEFANLKCPLPVEKLQNHTGISVIWRLKYYLKKYPDCKFDDFKEFTTSILKNSTSFDFSKIPQTENAYIILLRTLALTYSIKELRVPHVESFDVLALFATFFYFGSVEYIQFDNFDEDASISAFSEALKSSLNCRLKGISFHKSKLCEKSMSKLLDAMKEKNVASISFKEMTNQSSLSFISANESFSNIRYLSIRKTTFNFANIKNNLCNLYALSVAKCGKTVGEIFEIIMNENRLNLRTLDISGNFGSNIYGKKITLPVNLVTLKADKIQWETNDLLTFIDLAINQFPKDHLDLFHLSMNTTGVENWGEIWKYLKKKTAKYLKHFSFDNNKISEELVKFISRSKDIEYLSMNGCFDDSNIKLISPILVGNSKLQTLLIRGNEEKKISNFKDLIKELPLAADFRFIDLSCNDINSKVGLEITKALAKLPNIEGFAMDNSKLNSCEEWCKILKPFEASKKNLFISLPLEDLKRFEEDPCSNDLNNVLYKLSREKKKKINYPDYSLFYFEKESFFPHYLKESSIRTIQEQQEAEKEEEEEEVNEINSDDLNDKVDITTKNIIKKEPKGNKRWTFPLEINIDIDQTEIIDRLDKKYSLPQIIKSYDDK